LRASRFADNAETLQILARSPYLGRPCAVF